MNAKQLNDLAENTFGKKLGLLSLQQEIAENFYPQRADFTVKRWLGDEFAGNLMSSFPILCARDLGGALPTMLRPTAKEWFEMTVSYGRKLDHDSKGWLSWATRVQRSAMYDIHSLFTRAMSQADMDFAVFGQTVIQCGMNQRRDALLHRTWHLRDCAWLEDDEGNVCPIFRNWKPQARVLVQKFPKTVDPKIKKAAEKEPFREIFCRHMIVDADLYDDKAQGRPYWAVTYDCENNSLLEAVPVWNKQYAIPRWQTVGGSQYSYSPAVVAALPEARLLQSMTYTLLEAGEKATNPPLKATEGAVRSDVAMYAGGLTWVDYEYDEKHGAALEALINDFGGLPFGADMQRDSRAILLKCFYADKLKPFVPTDDPEMTAFQAGQIVAQYIRDALPIFEPMEAEYNGQVCELDFDNLLRNGAFGSMMDMPKGLRDSDIDFRFQSPLHDAIEAQKGHKFLEMKQLILEAAALDKNVVALPNTIDALRDALDGIRVEPRWLHSEARVSEIIEGEAAKQQDQAMLANVTQLGEAGKLAGEAARNMAQAEAIAA